MSTLSGHLTTHTQSHTLPHVPCYNSITELKKKREKNLLLCTITTSYIRPSHYQHTFNNHLQ